MRRPRSLPLAARAFRLRCAGAAEVLRLKHDLTMQMVATPEAVVDDATERTALVPFETMDEMVNGKAAA